MFEEGRRREVGCMAWQSRAVVWESGRSSFGLIGIILEALNSIGDA